MKQRLGKKKHAKCEEITGQEYSSCWTRGGRPHGLAECHFGPNADWVNYLTGDHGPYIREREIV